MAKPFIQIRYLKTASLVIGLLLCIMLTFLSCTKDKSSSPEIPSIDPCDTISFLYQTDIFPIMNTYCSIGGCHDGSGSAPGNSTKYTWLKTKVDNGEFEQRAIELKDMPPYGTPGPQSINEEDLQKIKCWIQNGALEN